MVAERERVEYGGHLGDKGDLWIRYKRDGERGARDELIIGYSHLVKYTAGQMAMGMPAEVGPSDLETYGIFGLIDAMDRFDPERGIKFETYAVSRIKGAILDGVRKMDWVPASVRRKSKDIERAYRELYAKLGRGASDAELASHMGVSVDRLREDLGQTSRSALAYLDEARPGEGDDAIGSLMSSIPDESAEDPYEVLQWEESREKIADSIRSLGEKERLVITLYYYQGLTLSEIARIMELSPSRISQIHSKAVMRMRGMLSAERDLFAGGGP